MEVIIKWKMRETPGNTIQGMRHPLPLEPQKLKWNVELYQISFPNHFDQIFYTGERPGDAKALARGLSIRISEGRKLNYRERLGGRGLFRSFKANTESTELIL